MKAFFERIDKIGVIKCRQGKTLSLSSIVVLGMDRRHGKRRKRKRFFLRIAVIFEYQLEAAFIVYKPALAKVNEIHRIGQRLYFHTYIKLVRAAVYLLFNAFPLPFVPVGNV